MAIDLNKYLNINNNKNSYGGKTSILEEFLNDNQDRFNQMREETERKSAERAEEIRKLHEERQKENEKIKAQEAVTEKLRLEDKVFGKESFEKFSRNQDEIMKGYGKDPQSKGWKMWGYLIDTPSRIPGVNLAIDTAAKTFIGDENYEKAYTEGNYKKSTGNKILDTAAQYAGNIAGLSMNPGSTLGNNSMLTVADDMAAKAANKITGKMADKAGTRILNSVVRGAVDGGVGGGINSARLNKNSDEVRNDIVQGAIGGGVFAGATKTIGEGIGALKTLRTPKIETPNNIAENTVKTTPGIEDIGKGTINQPKKELVTEPINAIKNDMPVIPKIDTAKVSKTEALKAELQPQIKGAAENLLGEMKQTAPGQSPLEITARYKAANDMPKSIYKVFEENPSTSFNEVEATLRKIMEGKKVNGDVGKSVESALYELLIDGPGEAAAGINEAIPKKDYLNYLTDTPGVPKVENIASKTGVKQPTLEIPVDEKEFMQGTAAKAFDTRESKLKTNTWKKAEYLQGEEAQKVISEINAEYKVKTNAQTIENAAKQLDKNYNEIINRISTHGLNSAEDTAAAGLVTRDLIEKGDYDNLKTWLNGIRQEATELGQTIQAFRTWQDGSTEGTLIKASKEVTGSRNKILKDNPKLKNTIDTEVKAATKELSEAAKKAGKEVNQLDIEGIREGIFKKHDLPVLEAEDVQKIVDKMTEIEKLTDKEAKEIEFAKVKKMIAEKIVPSTGDKLKAMQMINLLLNTKTIGRNIKGNTVMAGLETAKDLPGAAIDKAISKFTGERTTLPPSLEGMKTKIKAGAKETKRTLVDFKEGIDRSPTDTQFELPPTKAFKMIESPKGIKERANNLLSKGEDLTRLGLSGGDRPFYSAAYEDAMRVERKLNPTKPISEMEKTSKMVADHATFHNNSTTAKVMTGIKRSLNKYGTKDFGVGDVILPFVKTPANIIDKAVDYTPIGGMRGLYNLSKNMKIGKVTQKEVVDQLARSVTGTTLMTVGAYLASQGVLTGKEDGNSKVANFKKQAGMTPYSIKTGNTYNTIDWIQPAAVPLMLGADIYQTLAKEKGSNITKAATEATKTGLSTIFNQSLLQGLNRLFGGYSQDAGQNLMDGVINTALQAPGQFVPFNSATKQIAQLTDKTYRDTSDENPVKQELNRIAVKIPGLSKKLPARVDVLGREQTTYEERSNPLDRLNDVFNRGGFKNTYAPTNAEKTIMDLYNKTGNSDLIPKKAPKKYTEKGVTYNLTPDEQRENQKKIGQQIMNNLSKNKSYSEKEIIKIINTAEERVKAEYLKSKKGKK